MGKNRDGIDTKKILSSFGRISKQWGLGESVGRVWGFLLFKSIPITQKEIEKGTNYSRGLVSRSLKKLKELDIIFITKKGKEFYYSTNASLIKGFNKVTKNFLETEIKPLTESLSKNLNKVEDNSIRKNINRMINEYKKLNLGISIFSKTMESIVLLNVENLKKIAKEYSKKQKGCE
jgi:DNA-binding transcriptional regulator GbsR (MarR family)